MNWLSTETIVYCCWWTWSTAGFCMYGIWLTLSTAQVVPMVLPLCGFSSCILNWYTAIIQSFRTDRSGQTVQTQIRLLLEEQSDQGLHCLLLHLHLFDEIPWELVSFSWILGRLQQSFLTSKNLGTLLYPLTVCSWLCTLSHLPEAYGAQDTHIWLQHYRPLVLAIIGENSLPSHRDC